MNSTSSVNRLPNWLSNELDACCTSTPQYHHNLLIKSFDLSGHTFYISQFPLEERELFSGNNTTRYLLTNSFHLSGRSSSQLVFESWGPRGSVLNLSSRRRPLFLFSTKQIPHQTNTPPNKYPTRSSLRYFFIFKIKATQPRCIWYREWIFGSFKMKEFGQFQLFIRKMIRPESEILKKFR